MLPSARMHRCPSVVAVCLSYVLVGCATSFDPYVKLPTRPVKENATVTGSVQRARDYVSDLRATLESDRSEQSITKSSLGALLGLGVGGAGVSALSGAGRYVTLGFASAGALAYAGGQIYAPKGYIDAYQDGINALICIEGKADEVDGTICSLKALISETHTERKFVIDAEKDVRAGDPSIDEAEAALATAQDVQSRALAALAMEDDYASALVQAAQQGIVLVNNEIKGASPDLAAIYSIASAVPGTAVDLANASVANRAALGSLAKGLEGKSTAKVFEGKSHGQDVLRARIRVLISSSNQLQALADKLLLAFTKRTDISACITISAGLPPPLTLEPKVSEITLSAGKPVNVIAIGDPKATRVGDWQLTAPTKIIRSSHPISADRTQFTFQVLAGAKAGESHAFLITELGPSGTRTQSFTVKVK